MTTTTTIRPVNNGFEFDYAGRVYRVWRHHSGRIVYKWNSGHATFPRNVNDNVRAGSAFCRLLFACAASIEESDCAGCAS